MRTENNLGSFLGLIVTFLCWVMGIVISVGIAIPALDQFRLISDLGGSRLVVSIVLGALVALLCSILLHRFEHPTCVGISLITGYFGGGIVGLSSGLALAYAIGHVSGWDARALMVIMALSGFGMGSGLAGAAAQADWEHLRAIAIYMGIVHAAILLSWALSASFSCDTQIVAIAIGVAGALLIMMRVKQ